MGLRVFQPGQTIKIGGRRGGLRVFGGGDPYPGVSVYDKFTDADNTLLTVHTPNKKHSTGWEATWGTFEVLSNRATWKTNGGAGGDAYSVAAIETGLADFVVSAILNVPADGYWQGVCGRIVDRNNLYLASLSKAGNFFRLARILSGAYTFENVAFTPVTGTDYALELSFVGDVITATLDGSNTLTMTDSSFNTATKAGLFATVTNNDIRFDEFQVTP